MYQMLYYRHLGCGKNQRRSPKELGTVFFKNHTHQETILMVVIAVALLPSVPPKIAPAAADFN